MNKKNVLVILSVLGLLMFAGGGLNSTLAQVISGGGITVTPAPIMPIADEPTLPPTVTPAPIMPIADEPTLPPTTTPAPIMPIAGEPTPIPIGPAPIGSVVADPTPIPVLPIAGEPTLPPTVTPAPIMPIADEPTIPPSNNPVTPPTGGGSSGGGGGGGGGFGGRQILPPVGQVLGASTFRFTHDLRLRMRENDVTELQNRLATEGLFNVEPTGYFGQVTLAAVKAYQAKYLLHDVSGTVGFITRAHLNGDLARLQAMLQSIITLLHQLVASGQLH